MAPTRIPRPSTGIDQLLRGDVSSFAILHRPTVTGAGRLELLTGGFCQLTTIFDLPLSEQGHDIGPELLVLVPFQQIAERGFDHRADGTPLLAMTVHQHQRLSVKEFTRQIPDSPVRLCGGGFDLSDEEYASLVRRIISEEIGRGEGSNFVLKREFLAQIEDFSVPVALALYSRLLRGEAGTYWTFLVHTGDRTLIGATPERHVSVCDGTVTMNPISGTYRYPPAGPDLADLRRFLADRKEADELYMVVDEELKMMARICDRGIRVRGPRLKQMGVLAHTEYLLTGQSSRDVREILRETMFAPTVTGSPLENACRTIARHERTGRGYYAGMIALVGRERGRRTLDASIVIRTANIDQRGVMTIGVGATLVRHSDPASEVAETRAKADGVLAAIRGSHRPARPLQGESLARHPEVRRALAARNVHLSSFWLRPGSGRAQPLAAELAGGRVLVVDAEDTFTSMLAYQLRSLDLVVTVRRFDESFDLSRYKAVVVGPGPGDPRDGADQKIVVLRDLVRRLLTRGLPFLAVCLGHQVLSGVLGLRLGRLPVPHQGLQRSIDYFGRTERVGLYHTFTAWCDTDQFRSPVVSGLVQASREHSTGQVHGLRGPGFRSMQFHPESVLTERGPDILAEALISLGGSTPAVRAR